MNFFFNLTNNQINVMSAHIGGSHNDVGIAMPLENSQCMFDRRMQWRINMDGHTTVTFHMC